jgi:hypothetical protein
VLDLRLPDVAGETVATELLKRDERSDQGAQTAPPPPNGVQHLTHNRNRPVRIGPRRRSRCREGVSRGCEAPAHALAAAATWAGQLGGGVASRADEEDREAHELSGVLAC